MGRGTDLRPSERQAHAERGHQMTLIYTIMLCLVSVIFVQFLLLTVAWEDYTGRAGGVVSPTALVSGLCFVVACWLISYIPRSERP